LDKLRRDFRDALPKTFIVEFTGKPAGVRTLINGFNGPQNARNLHGSIRVRFDRLPLIIGRSIS